MVVALVPMWLVIVVWVLPLVVVPTWLGASSGWSRPVLVLVRLTVMLSALVAVKEGGEERGVLWVRDDCGPVEALGEGDWSGFVRGWGVGWVWW